MIAGHFFVFTYQIFFYCSPNIFLIMLSNFLSCVKMKSTQYCSAETIVWRCFVKKGFQEILQNSQENTCGEVSLLKFQVDCRFIRKVSLAQLFPCNFTKFSRTSILKNWSITGIGGLEELLSEANLECLFKIKVSGPSWKMFSQQYYLKLVKLWQKDKNSQFVHKKRDT